MKFASRPLLRFIDLHDCVSAYPHLIRVPLVRSGVSAAKEPLNERASLS